MIGIKKKINENGPYLIEKLGNIINPFILKFKNESNRLLIFYFHGLYKSDAEKKLDHVDPQNNITIQQFTEFIDYFLHHNYKFIRPDDILKGLRKDQSYVMITFDDGYFNNTLAIEVLNKYEIPATIFVTTRNIIENKSFWWDIIYKYRIKEGINLEAIRREQASLKDYKYSYIDEYITQNFGLDSLKPWSDIDRPLTESELKNLSQNPLITIGNHTHNHAILTNYNEEEIIEELALSNKILSAIIGFTPVSMAFPNGNFNNLTSAIAEKAGFRYIFTTQKQINKLPISDRNVISLNRFMAKNSEIKNYGSFCRLDYHPGLLYYDIKSRLMIFKKK